MSTKIVERVVAPGEREVGAGSKLRRNADRVLGDPVVRVVARRLLLAVPLLVVVSALSFVLEKLSPTQAVDVILPHGTVAQRALLSRQLGFDLPVYDQYWHWLSHALGGNLGASYFTGQPVAALIAQRFPVTLSLIIPTVLVMFALGVGAGVVSAVRGGVVGRAVDAVSLIWFAMPGFWVGAVLVAFFAVRLRWFPAIGYVPFSQSPGEWARSMVLPVTALALLPTAVMARQMREAMMDVLASEHVRMAWANGIPPRLIHFRLALKNASIRAVTVGGLQVIGLLAGTLFVEQVFQLPGLGGALTTAASEGDVPVTQGIVVFFTVIIVGINLVVDLVYTLLDPRVRTS
jgi:peptide/nickel transport system permease protein